ncbi:MAG: TonB-dependent siderophore receptor [Burkholderiales bacterium]|nr:TonB-dependent siderophore receptor [Burkholderiales bacterium]
MGLLAAAASAQTTQSTPPASVAAPASAPAPSTAAAASAATQTLAPVRITGRAPAGAGVAGWGDVPVSQAPLQATTVDAAQIRESGVRRLSDLGRFDASVSDAYDTEGYIDYFTVRGFVIDNRFNYRRDGLPINAETSIPLDNKARVDILKGLSGMQAGTSAPGGLVDLVVKRPLAAPLSSAFLEWRERGSVLGAVDLSRRFGNDDAFGLRLNAAAEHIEPNLRDSNGHRRLLALAGDWRVARGTLLEAEVETSHRSQPSVPGFSLLGDVLPSVPNPRLNLNNQPWSQPVVFDATTASLRVTQELNEQWRVVAHGAVQRLRTDDRIAFPFGCFDPEPAPDGTYYPDRYCPNGNFDLYDFRSENEKRRNDVLDLSLHGRFATGAVSHTLVAGAQQSRVRQRFEAQAFNFVGTGNVDGTAATPDDPTLTTPSTNRDERSTELYLRDAIALNTRTTVWLGARHTRLQRSTDATDGSSHTDYSQSFTTPFAAASYAFAPGQIVYASWGQGVESDVAPDLPRYTNRGQAIAAARSRQTEIGLKGGSERLEWSLAAFDIRKPRFDDTGDCAAGDGDAPDCTRVLAGAQRHRGIEAGGAWRQGGLELRGGAQWLRARVEDTPDGALDGKRPTNVPALTLRLQASYAVAAVPGFAVQGGASYESQREVLPDNSVEIPSVTRFDLGLRLERRLAGAAWTLRAGVDNLFDRRAWRESPYQFSHAYLFPLAPRTWRMSLQADL